MISFTIICLTQALYIFILLPVFIIFSLFISLQFCFFHHLHHLYLCSLHISTLASRIKYSTYRVISLVQGNYNLDITLTIAIYIYIYILILDSYITHVKERCQNDVIKIMQYIHISHNNLQHHTQSNIKS